MKRIACLAVAMMSAAAYAAPYTGPWTQEWDFNSGLQGWSVGEGAAWSETGGVGGSGGVSTPDRGFAELAGFALNGNPGAAPFVFQAEMWLPASTVHPGLNQDQGIGAYRTTDGKGPQLGGSTNMGMAAKDPSWDNTNRRSSWLFENTTARDQWHLLQIDYGVTTPGKWSAWVQLRGSGWWGTGPVWRAITTADTYPVNPDPLPAVFSVLRLGGVKTPLYGGAWGAARFDDAKLFVVPEPATALCLLVGGLLIARRRR